MSKAEDALARAQAKELRNKGAMKHLEGALVRKAMVTTTAGVYGAMDKLGVPAGIKGFPWKLGVWVIATTAEAMTKGMVQQAAGGIGDTTLGVFVHGAIAKGTLVAGDGGEV